MCAVGALHEEIAKSLLAMIKPNGPRTYLLTGCNSGLGLKSLRVLTLRGAHVIAAEANKQVSADIAHDLRKPLASTLRRLEAARGDDASSEMVRGTIETAIGEIEGVLETFNALLRIGQVEAGARRAAFRPLDLAEVAREVVETFEPAAEEEGKTIVSRLDGPLPMPGDKELLVQMTANLIDTALRHTPAGVRVEVTGERTPRGVSLSVADDGAGVAPEELKAIFQRFHRADAARKSPEPDRRLGARKLADLPLWSESIPAWWNWESLKAALPSYEGWDVWIEWYEERLRGGSRGEAYELVFASVPPDVLDKGPAAANAWIRAHHGAGIGRPEPAGPPQAVAQASMRGKGFRAGGASRCSDPQTPSGRTPRLPG